MERTRAPFFRPGRSGNYDYRVLATGMGHAYFGHDGWAAHAPGLKTICESRNVRGISG